MRNVNNVMNQNEARIMELLEMAKICECENRKALIYKEVANGVKLERNMQFHSNRINELIDGYGEADTVEKELIMEEIKFNIDALSNMARCAGVEFYLSLNIEGEI